MATPLAPSAADAIAADLLKGTGARRSTAREKSGQQTFLKTVEAWRRLGLPLYSMKIHGGLYGTRGRPDTNVIAAGLSLWFEWKAPGKQGATTASQDHEIAKLRAAGAHAEVVVDPHRALAVVARTLVARGVSLPHDIASRYAV